MSNDTIRAALEGAVGYLSKHPDDAKSTDSAATATIEQGLVCVVRGPDGAEIRTDMVQSVGGTDSAPSPGWVFRAALASCDATLIAMRAAQEGVALSTIEVTVDSESDDRGILGIDPSVPPGPLSVRTRIRVAADGGNEEQVREVVRWGEEHCPIADTTKRAVPVDVDINTSATPPPDRA
jgi:uncharacterized OsmC-like protein